MKIYQFSKIGLIFWIILSSMQISAAEKIFLIKNEAFHPSIHQTTRFYVVDKNFDGSTVYEFERSYGKLQKLVRTQKFTSEESLSKLNEDHELSYGIMDLDFEFETFVPSNSLTEPTVLWPNRNQWNDPTRNWEQEFGKFVSEIPLNLFYDLGLEIDCADVVYGLRWIFARMNFLPMNYTVSGGRKMSNSRFPREWLPLNTSDRLEKSWKEDKVFLKSLRYMMDVTYTSTLPSDSDLLQPKVQNIRPGVINYWGFHSQYIQKVDNSGENVPVTVVETSVPQMLKPLTQYLIFEPKNFRQFRPNGISSDLKIQNPNLDPDSRLDSDAMFGGYTSMAEMVVDKNLLKKNVSKIKNSFNLTLQTMLNQRSQAIELAQKECIDKPLNCAFGSSQFENFSTPSRDQRISDTFASMQVFLEWIDPSENMENPDLTISLGGEKISIDFSTFVENINQSFVSYVPLDPPMLRWGYSLKQESQATDNSTYIKELDSIQKSKLVFENFFDNSPTKSILFSLRHLDLSSQKIAYTWMSDCLSKISENLENHATCFDELRKSGFKEFQTELHLNTPKIKLPTLSFNPEQGLILKHEESVFESNYYLVVAGRWIYRKSDMKMYDFFESLFKTAVPVTKKNDETDRKEFNSYLKQSGQYHSSIDGIYFNDENQKYHSFLLNLSNPDSPQVIPMESELYIFNDKIIAFDEIEKKLKLYHWNNDLVLDTELKFDHFEILKEIKNELNKMIFVQFSDDKSTYVYSTYGERKIFIDDNFWSSTFNNFFVDIKGDLYFSSNQLSSTALSRWKSFLQNSQFKWESVIISKTENLSFNDFLNENFVIFDNQLFQLNWANQQTNSRIIGEYTPINLLASPDRFLLQSQKEESNFILIERQNLFNRKLPFRAPEGSDYSFNGDELDIYYTKEQDGSLITKGVNNNFSPINAWPSDKNLQLLDHKTVDRNYSKFWILPDLSQPVDQILLRDQLANLGGHGFFEQKFSLSGQFQKNSIFEASSSQIVDDFCEAKNFESERVYLKTYQLSRLCGDMFLLTSIKK